LHIASNARSAAPSESCLGDHEAVALAGDQVARRHAHVLEEDFGVALLVLVAEDGQASYDLHTGRIDRHEDLALLAMARSRRLRLAHHDHDLAVRMQRS
jgi:hypothetical protein